MLGNKFGLVESVGKYVSSARLEFVAHFLSSSLHDLFDLVILTVFPGELESVVIFLMVISY